MSTVDSEILMACATCGASIYREHIHRGLAGMWGGRMLCPACLKPRRESGQGQPATETADSPPTEAANDAPPADEAEESSAEASVEAGANETTTEETISGNSHGARHVRTFHAKLSEAALRHMDEQVNSWLKSRPQIQVKFANTTVGIFEGKHSEPNMILTIFF